jgi:sulfide:quinone oxidoreductase
MPVEQPSAVKGKQDNLRVVIAGGGVAALETALALRSLAEERVVIQLIAPEPHFWYRPLSVLEPFGGGRVQPLELVDLARACGADFDLGALASVDAAARVAHTAAGAAYEYDRLVIACGARMRDALAGAFTFRGSGDSAAFAGLLEEPADAGVRLVFAVPAGVTWPLPLYELALLTAAHFAGRDVRRVEIALVTPEEAPLALFGAEASSAIAQLPEQRGIAVHLGRSPVSVDGGTLTLSPSGSLPADRVVALPRLEGRAIPGVPYDSAGFTRTDVHGRVVGLADVYAAGDATAFPVKQGGLAAQQADAVAEAIAAEAGAPVTPKPFRPILRGLLLTGGRPAYLRAEIAGGAGETTSVSTEALWWPPGKIVGRYLAPFLAENANVSLSPLSDTHEALPIEVDL